MIMKRAPVSCGSLNGLEINRSLPHETRHQPGDRIGHMKEDER